jgi:hypothetical protein
MESPNTKSVTSTRKSRREDGGHKNPCRLDPAKDLLSSTTTHDTSMDGHSAHINIDNEYSFQTYIMEDFHSNSNKFFITSFILHKLPKANPTGSLL